MTKTAFTFGEHPKPFSCPTLTKEGSEWFRCFRTLTKILVMKLAILLLTTAFLQVHASGRAQGVTLAGKEITLKQVFEAIEKQTDYVFFSNESFLTNAKKISLSVYGVSVNELLDLVLKNQPIVYTIKNKTIILSKKTDSTLAPPGSQETGFVSPESALGITVTGMVYNKRFEPLANASVMVLGTSKGVSTKVNGSFKLEGLKAEDVLRITFIGYKPVDISVKDQQQITVVMEDANNELDQVVAQGYSKTTQRLSTTSVAKITADEIGRQPIQNPLLAMQGRVPGLVVTPFSTYNSAPIKLDIRGRGLLNGGAGSPLIIIDGVPLNVASNQGTEYGNGPIQGVAALFNPAGSQSPLFGLNPRDIESIEVLKDVGSTAIYGSAGANGVILITTKKGKSGTSNIDVDVNYGVSKITRYWDMLNTQQYLEMRREAFKNDGITPSVENAPDLMLWDTTRYTNWQKEVWGNTGKEFNATIGFSGGTPQLTHRISANYSTSEAITTTSGKDERMGVSLALNRKSNNQKLTVNLSANYYYTHSNMTSSPFVQDLPPNAPPIFNEDGTLNYKPWNDAGIAMSTQFWSFENMLKPTDTKVNTLNAGLRLSYQLLPGLNAVASLGSNSSQGNSIFLNPIIKGNPFASTTGMAVFGKSQSSTWTVEPQLNYDTWLFGNGRLSIVTGATIKKEKRESLSLMAGGYTNDALLKSLAYATFVQSYNSFVPYKYNGVFGRLGYVWKSKYILDLNARRDGSSRFGPGNRFGNFGSVGLGWVASDEPWIQKRISPLVNFLKFYSNFGIAGDDGGGDYQYLSQWGKEYGMLDYDEVAPMVNMHAVNQEYHWQLAKELNLGMELRLLKDGGVGLNVNYYRKRLTDQLLPIPTPVYTGFPSVFGNQHATVQNEGWEFRLTATVINKKDFSYNASINASLNRNKLISFKDIESSSYFSGLLPGYSTNTLFLLNYLGVDPMTGSYQFEDYNHDGMLINNSSGPPLSPGNDLQKVVDMAPKVTGGTTHSFQYKNLALYLTFDYKIQQGRSAFYSLSNPGGTTNIPVEIYNDRWQKPGDITSYAKFSTISDGYLRSNSTLAFTDASFIRLNTISLGYTLSEKLANKLNVKQCAFNISARNIFVITRYKGIDPEIQIFNSMPPQRTITAGFSLSL